MEDRARIQTHLRKASIGLGVLAIAGAFLVDVLGLGGGGGLGVGQVLLAGVGLFFLLLGIFGRRFGGIYRGFAIGLLNTFLLFGLVEIGAIVMARTGWLVRQRATLDLPYYDRQDWSDTYWREAAQSESYRYEPYLIWRHRPFSGQTVNYEESGRRVVPESACENASVRVFTFGGSTMLGWGAPDWGTIPAYLSQSLRERHGDAVCVVNQAEDGFVSTQGVLALALELQKGNVPEVAVFYDGVNDVLAALESGQPRAHVTLAKIASRFEQREHPLLLWYKSTRQYALLQRWVADAARREAPEPAASSDLPQLVARTYLENYRLVESLARTHGFEFYFFLQPHLGLGGKPLTSEERQMADGMIPGSIPLAQAVYEAVADAPDRGEHLWILADVFDAQTDAIWIDGAGHVTPEGNALVAKAMLTQLAGSAAMQALPSPDDAPAPVSPGTAGKAPGS